MKIIMLLFFLILCWTGDDRAEKDRIFRLVQEDQQRLTFAIESGDFSYFDDSQVIQDIAVCENYVEFSCGGAGVGPQTAYCGFYYTETDDMYAIWCAPSGGETLTSAGEGYLWEEENGDNRYYTEKICDNFYYYEASF